MKSMKKQIIISALGVMLMASCADQFDQTFEVGRPDNVAEYGYLNDYKPLKEYVTDPNFHLGIGTTVSDYLKQDLVYALTNSNFNETVAGNAMKMSSCVNDKGEMDFSAVSEYVKTATDAGMNVYGHTLAWHSQQPAKWLTSLIADKPVPYDPSAPKAFAYVEQVTNGDCEGTEAGNFVVREKGQPDANRIDNGVGVNGSRGIKVHSVEDAGDDWNTQFFIYTPDHIWTAGEKYQFKMMARADKPASVSLQAHNAPGGYIHWSMLAGSYSLTSEWQEFTYEGEISGDQAAQEMHTIAFNLNVDKGDNNYYFDNMSWKAWMESDGPVIIQQNLIDNGNMEGSDAKNFASKENSGSINYVITDGVGKDGSRGVKIASKGGQADAWESQFWIVSNEVLQEGTTVHVEFDYRADGGCAGTGVDTQAHFGPGEYQHWSCAGTVQFTTDWQHYTKDFTVDASMAGANGMKSIAFNMSPNSADGTYYIDNVVLWTEKEVAGGGGPVQYWENLIENSDMEGSGNSNFVTKENNGAIVNSSFVDGAGKDGSRGIQITSNAGAAEDWDTQFWIVMPEPLPEGTTMHVQFDYKASQSASADTQAHFNPGEYQHWSCIGSPEFTTDWQHYDKEVTIDGSMAGANGMKSIAFNLAKNRSSQVTYYFDNIVVEVEKESTSGGIPQSAEEKRDTLTYAMDKWISGMMEACKDDNGNTLVKAWDVVNEAISGGQPDSEGVYALQHGKAGDEANFFWQDYMGDLDYVRTAVKLARQYGGNDLKLFVNDYNLESDWDNNAKVKSLIAWINRWEADGVTRIDGIGSQMHISCYANPATQESKKKAITNMLKLLAESGKLIRISELDMGYVDADGNSVKTVDMTEEQHHQMADLYTWLIKEYRSIIPAAQQWGICQWCATDAPANSGWRGGEPVGLWDQNFYRKHTYAGFANGLSD